MTTTMTTTMALRARTILMMITMSTITSMTIIPIRKITVIITTMTRIT